MTWSFITFHSLVSQVKSDCNDNVILRRIRIAAKGHQRFKAVLVVARARKERRRRAPGLVIFHARVRPLLRRHGRVLVAALVTQHCSRPCLLKFADLTCNMADEVRAFLGWLGYGA